MSKYFTPTSLGGEHLKIVQLTRCVQKQAWAAEASTINNTSLSKISVAEINFQLFFL